MENEKLELMKKLQQSDEVYVIMSVFTKMPFVVCNEETFDDEILIFFDEETAKQEAKRFIDQDDAVLISKVENKLFLEFYTSLFPIGINCLRIGKGTPEETTIQHRELVKRQGEDKTADGKVRVENPELHLTMLYFAQAIRKNPEADLTELHEEMQAHFKRGRYIVAGEEGKGIPMLKQKDGKGYLPIFTDYIEFQKFNKEGKFQGAFIPAEKLPDFMTEQIGGVIVNPLGVNLILNIEKIQPEQEEKSEEE